MAPIRGPARAFCTLGSALLLLTGCGKLSHNDSDWARAALERNPDLTIVASDKDAKTFTVQVKGNPDLRVVRVDEIIGSIPSNGLASAVREPVTSTQPATAAAETSQLEEPANTAASAGEPARPAEEVNARAQAQPVDQGVTSGTAVIQNAAGKVLASTDGAIAPQSAGAAANSKVLASGPGYSISAGEPRGNRSIRLAEATPARSPSNVAVEKRYEPMICQGGRLLHIDGRNLEFEGDAVSALDGCEIHITNSHIIARGIGVSARAANVHIKNSIIEGASGSVSASQGSKVYTQQSTFKGLSRRLDTSTFTDLGGTVWN